MMVKFISVFFEVFRIVLISPICTVSFFICLPAHHCFSIYLCIYLSIYIYLSTSIYLHLSIYSIHLQHIPGMPLPQHRSVDELLAATDATAKQRLGSLSGNAALDEVRNAMSGLAVAHHNDMQQQHHQQHGGNGGGRRAPSSPRGGNGDMMRGSGDTGACV
jgi:hypothetical protein